ncbi:MAG: N-acetylmuramoyl-L-alanine amidase [Coriobacteriales bacterium]|nr:N-acetylmuramoyl-L-alanine amidase [Coriobacteriales bacterium]
MRARLTVRRALALALAFAVLAPQAASATTVCIDAGHGGRYSNANANGLREKDVNLWVARSLRDKLQAKSIGVTMTRNSDRAVSLSDRATWNWNSGTHRYEYRKDGHTGMYTGIPRDDLQARCDVASSAGVDLFVSIHCNGASSSAANGTEDWASQGDPLGRELAGYVQRSVVKATSLRNRGSFTGEFYVLRWSNMPAILVENAFITNPREARLLKSPSFRSRLAGGIANGISSWLATKPFDRLWTRRTSATASGMAAEVSSADYATGSTNVVIVRLDAWRDAATAPVLASRLGAPLLFVESTVPPETTQELERLSPDSLTLVGPDGSFSETTTAQLAEAADVATSAITTIGGPDRRAVSASVATSVGVPASGEIVLAYQDSSEALQQAMAYAARKKAPLLLTWHDNLGQSAQEFVDANRSSIKRVTVFGSTRDVTPGAVAGLPNVQRIYSADRSEWAAATNFRFPTPAAGKMRPMVVNAKLPLARMVAASHAARRNQPIVLTEGSSLRNRSRMFIAYRRVAIGSFEVIDVNGSIPNTMDHCLRKADYPWSR